MAHRFLLMHEIWVLRLQYLKVKRLCSLPRAPDRRNPLSHGGPLGALVRCTDWITDCYTTSLSRCLFVSLCMSLCLCPCLCLCLCRSLCIALTLCLCPCLYLCLCPCLSLCVPECCLSLFLSILSTMRYRFAEWLNVLLPYAFRPNSNHLNLSWSRGYS